MNSEYENDPHWAAELELDDYEKWKKRAERQLQRAREAEKRVEELEKKVREFECFDQPKATGSTVLECIQNLADDHEWGEVDEDSIYDLGDSDEDDGPYVWGVGFQVGEEGTSKKAAGIIVPGGMICTWRK